MSRSAVRRCLVWRLAPLYDAAMAQRADRFLDEAIELLRSVLRNRPSVEDEPGLPQWISQLLDPEDDRTYIQLGTNDALTLGRPPSEADNHMYFVALVSMLTRPGTRSAPLTDKLVRKALRKFKLPRPEREELVNEVMQQFLKRTDPIHFGDVPLTKDFRSVVSRAVNYVIAAARLGAISVLKKEKRVRKGWSLGDLDYNNISSEENKARCASLPDERDKDGRTANERRRHCYEGMFTLSQLSTASKRARSTIRKTVSKLELPTLKAPNGHDRLFTAEQAKLVLANLPPKRSSGPRRKTASTPRVRDRRQPYPKGMVVFGEDDYEETE